ncbi:MAG: formylglycine-generating enzyme family protein [Thermoguttaceae bacterium]
MRKFHRCVILGTTFALCLVNLVFGYYQSNGWMVAAGALGTIFVLWRIVVTRGARREEVVREAAVELQTARPIAASKPVDPSDTDGLVAQMLAQGRFSLLLRPQLAASLGEEHFRRALETLDESMGLVPDGEVVLGAIDAALDDGRLDQDEIIAARGRVVAVEPFFLDRRPVTNRQFYEFVAGGGYAQVALWDPKMWQAVLEMVDRTGMPGPRYWKDGCFLPDEKDHPVVGISWYEASAYARWIGKRLPSDAEWVKAGSWPVAMSPTTRMQRKYPWGDTMNRTAANLWGSGPERIVPVDEFDLGVSVGGIYQLIGNVWEWTCGNFRELSLCGERVSSCNPYPTGLDTQDYVPGDLILPTPMKSIRGGAFDTYFDNHATCQFQSGENPLKRRHNIGFRCAVAIGDLALIRPKSAEPENAAPQEAAPVDIAQQPGVGVSEAGVSEAGIPEAGIPEAEEISA